jgi:transcriptional regulator with XRE-family HTH domain
MAFNIIEYIIKNTDLKQKDIAKKLGVTTGQISKWKQGEYIASERKEELNKLAGLFGHHTEWAVLSKTKANSDVWFEYVLWHSSNELVSNREIEDEGDLKIPNIFILLSQLGMSIPSKAPKVKEIQSDDYKWTAFDMAMSKILRSYGILVEWNDKHFADLVSDIEIYEIVKRIQSEAINVALLNVEKVDREILLSTGIQQDLLVELIQETNVHVRELIRILLRKMNAKRLPITTDYFLYIDKSTEWLELEMMASDYSGGITQFLTYAERNLLEIQKYDNHLLESLNQKIDTLLSEKDKKKFNNITEKSNIKAKSDGNQTNSY